MIGNPDRQARIRDAVAFHQSGNLEDAERAYRQLLEEEPMNGAIWHNLGVLRAGLNDHAVALACFDEAIAGDAGYVSAHFNRAGSLRVLGRTDEAREGFTRAVALEPELYEAHLALGFLWLEAGNRGRSLDHFAETLELRRGDRRIGIAEQSLRRTTIAKLRHDAAQLRHIASRDRPRRPFMLHARAWEAVADELGAGVVEMSETQLERLAGIYNTAWYMVDTPEVARPAVNSALDSEGIERRFEQEGITWFDNFLSSEALAGLRRFLLESTIWSDFTHIDGFLATYLEDGLACPLVLQIADEVRSMFPGVMRGYPLTQAWAFKALDPARPIALHSDDGAVSLNFWLTPDTANREPAGGGLVVHNDCGAAGWYDTDHPRGRAGHGNRHVVPYRENRAVLFRSQLLHGSDAPNFRTGYENHRINLTLLYGQTKRNKIGI